MGGTLVVHGTDEVELRLDVEDEVFTLFAHPNAAKDILFKVSEYPPEEWIETEYQLQMLTRKPASLALTDVVGDWKLIQLELAPNEGVSAVAPTAEVMALSILPNGDIDVGEVIGQASATTNQRVFFDLGDETLSFDINASKSTMVNMDANDAGDVYVRILVKTAALASLNPVAGDWNVGVLGVEDVDQRDYTAFETEGLSVTFSAAGTYTTPDGSGGLSIHEGTGIALSDDDGPVAFQLNASRDFAARGFARDDDSFHEVVLIAKEPSVLAASELAGDWTFNELYIEHLQNTPQRTNVFYHADETTVSRRFEGFFDLGREIRNGFFEEFHTNGVLAFEANYVTNEPFGWERGYSVDGDVTEERFYGATNQMWTYAYHAPGALHFFSGTLFDTNGSLFAEYYGDFRADGRTNYLSSRRFEGEQWLDWSTNWSYRVDDTLEGVSGSHFLGDPVWSWWEDYHSNGLTLAASGSTSNGLEHGEFAEFAENGQLTASRFYTLGERTGDWAEYTAAGVQTLRERYIGDRLSGIRREWNAAGTLLLDGFYFAGRRHGDFRFYRDDGQIDRHERFEHEALTYSKTYYYVEGVLNSTGETTYGPEGDRHESRTFWPNGQLKSVTRQFENDYDGEQLRYAENGDPLSRETYVRGVLNGPWEAYWESNGGPMIQGAYTNNLKTGVWNEYAENGQQIREETYTRGVYNGAVKAWREDGEPREESVYAYGHLQRQTSYGYHEGTRVVSYEHSMWHDDAGRWETSIYYSESGGMLQRWHRLNGANHGAVEHWTDSGQRTSFAEYEGNLLHGLNETWDDDGTLRSSGTYRYGKRHGEHSSYRENGDLSTREQYVDGLKSGLSLRYHENGNLIARENYLNDQPHGEAKTYRSDGTLAWSGNYAEGLLEGRAESYYEDGTTLSSELRYSAGLLDGLAKYYYDDGFLYRTRMFVDGEQHGDQNDYAEHEGRSYLHIRTPYVNGVAHGTVTRWHAGGSPVYSTTTYLNGVASGAYRRYDTDGILRETGSYALGWPHGRWSNKHANGRTSSYTDYVYGVREGDYRSYSSSGVLQTKGQYTGGESSGTWTYYDSDGTISDTENFGAGGPPADGGGPAVSGLVRVALTGEEGEPVSGSALLEWDDESRSMWIGDSGVGTYNLQVESSISVSITAYGTGLSTNSTTVSLSRSQPNADVTLSLAGFEGPEIRDVAERSGDHFMYGIPFWAEYDVDVDWGDSTPSRFRVRVNGVEVEQYSWYGGDVAVDMGSFWFEPSAERGDNVVQLIAVSQEGLESEPIEFYPVVYPAPNWLPDIAGAFVVDSQNNTYTLGAAIPAEPFSAVADPSSWEDPIPDLWNSVPYVGGHPLGLLPTQVSMDLEVTTDGTGTAHAQGGSGFTAAGVTIAAKLAGDATIGFDAAERKSLELQEMGLNATLETELNRSIELLKLVPGLKTFAKAYPTLGGTIEHMASDAKVGLKIGLSGESSMDVDETPAGGLQFTNTYGWVRSDVELGLTLQPSELAMKTTGKGFARLNWAPSTEEESGLEYTLDGGGTIDLNFSWRNIDLINEQLVIWGDNDEIEPLEMSVAPMDTAFILQPMYNVLSEPSITSAEDDALVANIFPRAAPRLVAGDGAHGLIYVSMDPADSVAQGSEINFIHHDGVSNAPPRVIEDNAVGDFAPDALFLPDGRVLAVWERINDPALDGLDLAAFASALEIVWSVYTPSNEVWSAPVAITADTALDQAPRLLSDGTNVVVYWESNAAGEVLSTTNAPSELRVARWDGAAFAAAETLPTSFAGAYEFDAALLDGTLRVVFVQDADADFETTGDRDLYVWSGSITNIPAWSAPAQLTISETDEASPRVIATSYGFETYWTREGAVVRGDGLDLGGFTEILAPEAFAGAAEFEVLANGPDRLLAWVGDNEGRPDLAVSFANSNGWSGVDFLSADSALEYAVSSAILPNGDFALAYLREENDIASLRVVEFADDTDLIATGLRPEALPERGEWIDLTAEFENVGLTDVAIADVVLRERGGAPIDTNSVWFADDGSAETTWSFWAPTGSAQVVLIAEIDPDDEFAERSETNNAVELALFQPNLRVVDWSIEAVSGGTHRVSAEIANVGTFGAAASAIVFDAGDGVTSRVAFAALDLGETAETSVTFADADFFSNGVARVVITVDPDDEIAETSEGDNTLAITALEPSAGFVDADGDGLDDAWEWEHLGSLDGDGTADSDGDGMNDRAEYRAGTDPLDAQSALWMNLEIDAFDALVEWTTEPGVTYQLEYATDLASGVWTPIGGARETLGFGSSSDAQIDPLSAIEGRFYRVRVVTDD